MPRARDLGIRIGVLPTGPTNSLLDVPGVGVGHATIHRDEAGPPAGRGIARTGVTAVVVAEDAYHRRIPAGGAVLNGAGECTGFLTAQEWGAAETPVYLTSTMQLGRVYDAACELEIEANAAVADDVVIPIVGECDDSFLNDCRRMQVDRRGRACRPRRGAGLARLRVAARPRARSAPEPACPATTSRAGSVRRRGSPPRDTPSRCCCSPTSARARTWWSSGVPVGRLLDDARPRAEAGSCIGLVITDAPVDGATCQRLARRVGLGLARTGTVAHNGSGDIFLGFGTGMRLDRETGRPDRADLVTGPGLNALFSAVVEATEESVLNSLSPPRRSSAGTATPASPCTPPRFSHSWKESGRDRHPARRTHPCLRRCGARRNALPATRGRRPQPCLLEALPYRKDDLTSSYSSGYEDLRDRFGYAVCRVDVRGTGSSSGDATDEYPPEEQRDLVEVIAWLARQEWCNGNVGMFGTSYSGFNSLQLACERPPELKAIFAIFATDDRWTDDVHWRGGALRLVDLVDYNHYMTPMCVLPPVPAVWGEGWEDEWRHRLETNEPWVLTWLRENTHGDYWAHGSVRLGADGSGYERIECPTMLVAGWADGYRNNSFRTVAKLARERRSAPAPRRPVGARRPAYGDPRAPDRPGRRAGRLVRPLAASGPRRSEPFESHCDVFVRSSSRPEPDLDLHEGYWVHAADDPPDPAVLHRARGRAVPLRHPRHRHRGLDRLRRASAVGALDRPAPGRRPVPHVGPRPARRSDRRPAPRADPGQRRRAGRLPLGEAVRRLPRRNVRPRRPAARST